MNRRATGPKAYLQGPLTEDDPRHGTDRGYWKGCRKECCLRGHARRRKLERLYGPTPLVDATGTRRRVEALACLGWSASRLSLHLGAHKSYLRKIASNARIQQATAAAVAELYDELSMTVCTAPQAARTVNRAAVAGWAPPLAWDDIDDPDEQPALGVDPWGSSPDDLDPVVVQRVLDGDYRIRATRAEKLATADAWTARGWSLDELERLTGWNVFRIPRTAARLAAENAQDDDGEVSAA